MSFLQCMSRASDAMTDKINPCQFLFQDCSTCCVSEITTFALFVIACMAAAGAFPGATAGWVAVGIGAGGFVLNLMSGNLKERKWEIIAHALFAITLVAIGACGGTGILAANQVGGAILGTMFTLGFIKNCIPGVQQGLKMMEQGSGSHRRLD